jgi:hypothetical protein
VRRARRVEVGVELGERAYGRHVVALRGHHEQRLAEQRGRRRALLPRA